MTTLESDKAVGGAAVPRIDVIDGLRGYFLVFMLINHLVFNGGYWLIWVNQRQIAFVEDAQGFVFISGLLVGMVYGRKMLRGGFSRGAEALWRRSGEIYLYAMASLAGVLTLAWLAPRASQSWTDWLGALDWGNLPGLASAAALLYQPTLLDILPQYVVYMVASPVLVWACLRGHGGMVLVGSALLWLAAQFGLHQPFTAALNTWLAEHGRTGLRAHFNLMAWQMVFVSAMVLGVLTVTGRLRWEQVFRPDRTWLPKTALAICLFFLPFRVGLTANLIPPPILERFSQFELRGDFSLVYLLNFAAAGAGLAWLLIAGPGSPRAWIRKLSGLLLGLFRTPFLRLLGRHSLQIYAWHVLLVFGVRALDFYEGPFPQASRIAIALVCLALLMLPALWREGRVFKVAT
jgi:hypothetical protein